VVDWGWTAYDTWQSGRTLGNPNASRGEKMMAALNIGMAALFEVIEPDDILPVGLPIDDIARRGVLKGAAEALEVGGDEALEAFVRDQFGDHADEVLEGMWGALCSFSGDTVVMTEDGPVPISEVDLWDKVLAYNEETGEIGYYPVTDVWVHVDPVIVTLTIDGEQIETTPEHPFYTIDGEWLAAAALQIGDEIRTAEWETGMVESIHFTTAPQPMYNFTVATAHTYFVGDGQWLVHNDCADFITSANWEAISYTSSACKNGCEAVATKIQGFIGGDVYRVTDAYGAPSLGPLKNGHNPNWTHHDVVIKDGRVYDAFTGGGGLTIDEFRARFEYGEYLEFTLLNN
jgi:hypothetical protein